MAKVYVSIPISGRNIHTVMIESEKVKEYLSRLGHTPVTPFDVCPETNQPYAYYMGRDIEALLECEAIYLCPGWQESKGCRAEAAVAEIYGIPRFIPVRGWKRWFFMLSELFVVLLILSVIIIMCYTYGA